MKSIRKEKLCILFNESNRLEVTSNIDHYACIQSLLSCGWGLADSLPCLTSHYQFPMKILISITQLMSILETVVNYLILSCINFRKSSFSRLQEMFIYPSLHRRFTCSQCSCSSFFVRSSPFCPVCASWLLLIQQTMQKSFKFNSI